MAVTPEYGFVMPDPTDFVTDLPADFEIFGDAVDAQLKALNPGTTAGDVDYYTSSTAKARLGIGTAGQVLAVNSGATAPEWISVSSGAYTLLETINFAGASSYTSASIAGTFRDLYIVVRNFDPSIDNTGLKMRVNGITSGSYQDVTNFLQNTAFSPTSAEINANADDTSVDGLQIIIIPDYANTTTMKLIEAKSIVRNATTPTEVRFRYGFTPVNTTSAITSVTFLASSGNLNDGDAFIYGVK
jgi:hypothetical protein